MKKISLFFIIISQVASAQTIDNYLSPPFPTDLTASANGKTIAWVFNDKGSRNIFLAESPAFAAKQITNYSGDDGMEINSICLNSDGSKIVFVRGNTNNNRGEPANPAFLQTSTERVIWVIDNNGKNLYKIAAGSSPAISPDGKTVVYLSCGQIWTASLTDSLIKPQKLFQSRGRQSQLRWSPDGAMLAFISDREDHSFTGIYNFINQSTLFD